jgi:ketosteroid isomerase-like protein
MLSKKTLFVMLLIALVALAPLTAFADKTSDAKKAIQALYDKEVAAVKKKSVEGIFASNSPDFVYYSKGGQKVDAKALRAAMTQAMTMASSISAKMKIVKFTLNGDQAVVTTEGHLEMTITPPPNTPQAGKPVKIVSDDQSGDTWKKVKGKWM